MTRMLPLAALALACIVVSCMSATAACQPICVEVRDPGIRAYRISALQITAHGTPFVSSDGALLSRAALFT